MTNRLKDMMDGSAATSVEALEWSAPDTFEGIRDAYSRRAPQLWAFARRFGLSEEEAEDVVQEAFLRATRQIPGSIVNLDAWLFRVVNNLANDFHRRNAASVRWRATNARAMGDASDQESHFDDRVWLWAAVDRLPNRQRAVVYLRFRADFDFEVIAQILGISAGGARSNCARALESLRTWMVER